MPSLLSVIFRHKKAIVLITAAGFVLSAAVSLVLPPRFVASTMFAPVGVEKDITGLRDFFAPMGAFGESFAAYLRARKNYIIDYIIRSRRMSKLMDARFDLRGMYGTADFEEARRKLGEHTSLVIRDEGVIELGFEDRSRDRAIAVTDAYVAELDRILIDLTIESSRDRIAFLTGEIERREHEIEVTDSLLQDHLGRYGLYEMQQQVRAMLDIVSDLSSRLSVLDIEKKLLEMTMKPGGDELERVELEWNKLREQILLLRERGAAPNLFPPLKMLPEISTRYLQLMSERRMQEFVAAYLRLKLADAEVSANSHVSVLKILDPPAAPERRSWPKRKQMVLISTAAAFFWGCFFLLVRERWRERAFGVGGDASTGAPPGEGLDAGSEGG
jgi:capsule polysaccharide export protein KpsE/RkpR